MIGNENKNITDTYSKKTILLPVFSFDSKFSKNKVRMLVVRENLRLSNEFGNAQKLFKNLKASNCPFNFFKFTKIQQLPILQLCHFHYKPPHSQFHYALRCTTLHYAALRCTTLHYAALHIYIYTPNHDSCQIFSSKCSPYVH